MALSRLEKPVGEDNFRPDLVSLSPAAPGRRPTSLSVQHSFNAKSVMAPHGAPGARGRHGPKPLDQVRRRLASEVLYPLGPSAVESSVDLPEGTSECPALRATLGQRLVAPVLVAVKVGQLAP